MDSPEFSHEDMRNALLRIGEFVNTGEELHAWYEQQGIDRDFLNHIAEVTVGECAGAFVTGFVVAWEMTTRNSK